MARSVLVTGASSGIGRATVLHLAARGFAVFAGVRREEDAEALRREGRAVEPVILDVSDAAQVAALPERLGDELHGVVNNAGVSVAAPLEYIEIDELRHQLEVNLVAQLAVTQAVLPLLRRVRGRIVNVSSVGGRSALPFAGPYHASKWALEALSDSLRQELRPWGLEVVVIEPGSVRTEIWRKASEAAAAVRDRLPPEALERYGAAMDAMERTALKAGERGMPPEKVAKVVERALTAKRPRTRYVVGADARGQLLIAQLPDRAWDGFVARFAKLPRGTD